MHTLSIEHWTWSVDKRRKSGNDFSIWISVIYVSIRVHFFACLLFSFGNTCQNIVKRAYILLALRCFFFFLFFQWMVLLVLTMFLFTDRVCKRANKSACILFDEACGIDSSYWFTPQVCLLKCIHIKNSMMQCDEATHRDDLDCTNIEHTTDCNQPW